MEETDRRMTPPSPTSCIRRKWKLGIFSSPRETGGEIGIFPSLRTKEKVRNFSEFHSLYRGGDLENMKKYEGNLKNV